MAKDKSDSPVAVADPPVQPPVQPAAPQNFGPDVGLPKLEAFPAGPGPVPRVVNESARAAGTGAKRFKIRALDADRHVYRYILAASRADAEECYHKAEGFHVFAPQMRPKLVVTELVD